MALYFYPMVFEAESDCQKLVVRYFMVKFCWQYVRPVESQYYSCVQTAALYFCRLFSVLHLFLYSIIHRFSTHFTFEGFAKKIQVYSLVELDWLQSCEINFPFNVKFQQCAAKSCLLLDGKGITPMYARSICLACCLFAAEHIESPGFAGLSKFIYEIIMFWA